MKLLLRIVNVRTWLHRQGVDLDGQGLIDIREYGESTNG